MGETMQYALIGYGTASNGGVGAKIEAFKSPSCEILSGHGEIILPVEMITIF